MHNSQASQYSCRARGANKMKERRDEDDSLSLKKDDVVVSFNSLENIVVPVVMRNRGHEAVNVLQGGWDESGSMLEIQLVRW